MQSSRSLLIYFFLTLILVHLSFLGLNSVYSESQSVWLPRAGEWTVAKVQDNQVLLQTREKDYSFKYAPTITSYYNSVQPFDRLLLNRQFYFSKVEFELATEKTYSTSHIGEVAIFLNGKNFKETLYLNLIIQKNRLVKIALMETSIIDPSKKIYVKGNYRINKLDEKKISEDFRGTQKFLLEQNNKRVNLFLNNKIIYSFKGNEKYHWILGEKNNFHLGFRGVTGWIDNIVIYKSKHGDDNKQSLFIKEDFDNARLRIYKIKVRKIN